MAGGGGGFGWRQNGRTQQGCRVVPLSARTAISASTILSATVVAFYLHNDDAPFAGKLKVRRAFRLEDAYLNGLIF